MIFVNFCTFLLLYWKLFAITLFMVFIVFQVFARFCNIFSILVLFLESLSFVNHICNFCHYFFCREFLIRFRSGIFDLNYVFDFALSHFEGSFWLFRPFISGFLPFHWYFSKFSISELKLAGTYMGSPLAPIIHTYPYQFNMSILLPTSICLHYAYLYMQ